MTADDRSSIERNQVYWTSQAPEYAVYGERNWTTDEVSWGQFGIPESAVGALPDVDGSDVVEIGCGTAYFSAWLARRGAAPVGLDPTPAQLASARRFQSAIGPSFPLVRAAGERAPFRDASFDVAISEYGAAIWADPYEWIPEAARLLRPGGELVFLANAVLFILCAPDEEAPAATTLIRAQRGLHRVEYTDDEGVEFHLPHGDMVRLLRDTGFEVLDLIELYAPPDAADQQYITVDWATKWPMEEIWRARRR